LFLLWFLSTETTFPWWWALLPTLGAYLVISAGPQALFNRLYFHRVDGLGRFNPVIRFTCGIGPCSLLQPLWKSRRHRWHQGDTVALAFVLAWLTYLLIERPVRFGKRSKARISVLVLL